MKIKFTAAIKSFLFAAAMVIAAVFVNSHEAAAQEAGGTVVAPRVGGKAFKMPDSAQPKMSKEEFEKFVQENLTKVLSPAPKDTAPSGANRSRGEAVNSTGCGGAQSLLAIGYRGKCSIYQFTNYDFPNTKNSCGQAAIATAMWSVGLDKKYASDAEFAKSIWSFAPPKITLGNLIHLQDTLGTDWRQINAAMDGYGKLHGVKYTWVTGEAEIKKYLAMNLPVVIMLDTGTLKQFDYKWFTGHWVTAFGYDKDFVYV